MHVINNGTYVTTPEIDAQRACVAVVTSLTNTSHQEETATLMQYILDKEGKVVAKSDNRKVTVQPKDTVDVTQQLNLENPVLWSIDTPSMYTMKTIVKIGRKTVDDYRTPFGVRTIEFTADRGFFLNGQQVKLKGLCLHQDAGALGTAVPDRSSERRLEILKEYGCNAIRCAHNQPSPEFLDMCDRMGFIVIDEAFDKWKSGYYAKYFDEWWQKIWRICCCVTVIIRRLFCGVSETSCRKRGKALMKEWNVQKCCRILFTKKNRVVWQFSLHKTTIRKSFPV